MKGLKMTAKRILTGVLTAAMVVTSVNLPGMATSVQAATVYNDTATALSELAGSTGLKIYRLTSDDAGKELTSGIYYVDEDLTFTGADSTSSSEAGGNGLKIADGATVYLYIADGKTLTATGGKGYAGTDGANGTQATVKTGNGTYRGITYTNITGYENGKAGTGGNGATGGGAAIYVPSSSKVAILGNGSLNATGGTGGNAGNGQSGQKTIYSDIAFYVGGRSSVSLYSTTNNVGLKLSCTGTCNNNAGGAVTEIVTIGGAGGSGGGGAAGGGAGIGTNGANGNTGANGVIGNADNDEEGYVNRVAGNPAKANISASSSGQVYIGNVNVSATGGAGGLAGSQQAVVAKHKESLKYWEKNDSNTYSGTFYVQDGQSGGGGGAGGTGANIGTGGTGGQGGAGGDAGSCLTNNGFYDLYYTDYDTESVRGANGSTGTNGTGSSSKLGDTQYPYNNITFTNLTSANTKYYLTKPSTFTAPNYSVSENQIFVGWKVTTPAVKLPEAFGETADTQLTTANEIIPAGTEVSTAGIYGNITLEPYAVKHTHNWNYQTDSIDSSKVYAWCVGEENADACPYHGEEKKLTLSLNAEGKIYDGNAYNGATVEDKITSVTKANASSVTYYETDSDGNKTGSAISAPVNAGKYVAEVTVSDGSKSASATKAFEIKRADQTATVSMSGYEYGTTVSTPDVSGAKESPSVTYYYSTKNENKDGTEWKDIKNDTLDPGTYYMYAVLAQTDNYNTYTTAPVSFTVQGSDMSGVTAADVTKTYDGNSYGITVNTGSIPNATVTYGTEAGTYDLTDCPAYKNVGTYTICYKVEARGYNSFTGSATVTITKKAVTATVTAKNKTYDGTTDATVSAEVDSKDLVSGDSITINGITGTFDNKNSGTDKKVTVDSSNAEFIGTGIENYDITIGTEAKASIDKLTAEFNWSNTDLTYTGNEQSVTAEVKNAINGDKFTLTYDGNKQTAVDSYTAKVTALGNDNYKLPEAGKGQTAWSISYLAAGNVTVTGAKGDNDWYVTNVTITPENGYLISTDGREWQTSLEYSAQGEQTAAYCLMEKETGFITDRKSESFKIDTDYPSGEIKVKENGFVEFLNNITFKYFFKKTVDVNITGYDAMSGVAKIEYQKVEKGSTYDVDGVWTEGKSFSIAANDKSAIYARITDNAGNFVIINSDGIVVYTDATASDSIEYTKTTLSDVTSGIAFNGNTVKAVRNGETVLIEDEDYAVTDGKLVIKGAYLDTLPAGEHKLTVSYNPYGENFTETSEGTDADDSTINVTVKRVDAANAGTRITNAGSMSKVYDGQTVAKAQSESKSIGASKTEYKKSGAPDDTYTTELPTDAGEYVVRVTYAEDENYEESAATEEFTISPKAVTVVVTAEDKTYDGTATANVSGRVDTGVAGQTITVTGFAGNFIDRNAASDKTVTVDSTGVTATAGENTKLSNYVISYPATAKASILKKEITAVVTAADKVYDGTAIADVTATVETGIAGEELVITGLAGTFSDRNVGTGKTVTIDSTYAVAGAGDDAGKTDVDNYIVVYPDSTTASISAKAVAFTWGRADLTYTGTEQKITAEVINKADESDSFTLVYEDNFATEVGNHTAKVTGLGNDNYTLVGAENAEREWSISYLETDRTAQVSGDTKNDSGWYTGDVTLTPGEGWQISEDGVNWVEAIKITDDGQKEVTYYLKDENGYITDTKKVTVRRDTTLPEGEISVGKNGFTSFLNTITFGYFFKNTVDVKISGTDATSGIAKIEYQKVEKGSTYDVDGAWTEGKSFSIAANDKSAIYARITDNAGNFVIINSDGIVVYTDATATAAEQFFKSSGKDLTTGISVNGNTITSVMIEKTEDKSAESVPASEYEIEGDKLVLKASYLQTLAAGTYTLTVSYSPYGEAYTADSKGEAPDTSVITLDVIGEMKVFAEGYTGTYNGEAHGITVNVTEPADAAAFNVKITYGTMDADGNITYSENAVTYKDAGEYTVYYKVTADRYEDFMGYAVIDIKPAKAVVTVDNAVKHIGKADPSFTCKVTGLVSGETLEDILLERTEGETAGDYVITASAKEGSNANYDVTFVAGKLTIEDHIKAETSVVENRIEANCTEAGSYDEVYYCTVDECKAELERVHRTIPAIGHDWSEWVKAGDREKSTCLSCGQVRYRNIETADTGNFEKDAEVAPGSPIEEAVLDNDKSELIAADGIFTPEEKALIEAGVDARVWLEIAKTDEAGISAEDKAAVIKAAEKIMGENPDILFFDANLFKQVADGDKTQLHEPGIAIKITIQVPSELLNHDRSMVREYKIIRLHDGETDVLGGSFNESTNEFTFETDKFSTYAIAYADRPVNNGGSDDKPGDITEPDNKPDDNNTGDGSGTGSGEYIVSPSTGYTTDYGTQWILLAMVFMAGVIFISAGRKKNSRQQTEHINN